MGKRYKRHRDYGFFDQDIRLSKLSELGDPLERNELPRPKGTRYQAEDNFILV